MSVLTPPAPPTPGRTARSALGLLRERAWLGALLGVVVLSIIFVFLGRWQYHRHEAKSARNALVNMNYDAAPVSLPSLVPSPGQSLPRHLEWRPVSVTGSYLNDQTVLLRNRPQESENGYDVVIPFAVSSGQIFYIDRGWIPAGTRSAARPDSMPPTPTGTVTVVARLRPSEHASSRSAPPGQSDRLNVARLSASLPAADRPAVVNAYGAMISETPPAAAAPSPYDKPDPGLGINFAYAVQWVAFAIAAYVLFGVAMVREVRRREGRVVEPVSDRLRRWRPNLGDMDE